VESLCIFAAGTQAVSPGHSIVKTAINKKEFKYPWIDITKLKNERFILQTESQSSRRTVDIIFSEMNCTPNVVTTTKSLFSIIRLVKSGYGICFAIDSQLKATDITDNKLTCLSFGKIPTIVSSVIAYRKGIDIPPYMSFFIDEMRKYYQER